MEARPTAQTACGSIRWLATSSVFRKMRSPVGFSCPTEHAPSWRADSRDGAELWHSRRKASTSSPAQRTETSLGGKPHPKRRQLFAVSQPTRDGCVRCITVPTAHSLPLEANDSIVRVWNAESGDMKYELPGHDSHIYSVMFHTNGQWLLSGDLKGTIRQWDLETGKKMRTFDAKKLHTYHGGQRVDYGGVRSLALSPDGKTLAAGGLHEAPNPFAGVNKPLILVFDWETQEIRQECVTDAVERGVIWRLAWLADGSLMGVSFRNSRYPVVLELRKDGRLPPIPTAKSGSRHGLASGWSPCGNSTSR